MEVSLKEGRTLKSSNQECREIFQKKNMPYLYLFIEKYKNSDLKKLSRFASGLEKDLSAVENAVASPLSNGFLSGYHMNKQHWITILLDGTVGESKILDFLNMSYDLIDGLRK